MDERSCVFTSSASSGVNLRFAVGVAGPRRNPSNQRENTVQHCSYACLTPVFNKADPVVPGSGIVIVIVGYALIHLQKKDY